MSLNIIDMPFEWTMKLVPVPLRGRGSGLREEGGRVLLDLVRVSVESARKLDGDVATWTAYHSVGSGAGRPMALKIDVPFFKSLQKVVRSFSL
jgi:hypothetical protein